MRRCPFYYHTIRIAENDIKLAHVLGGKLPELKLKAGGVRLNSFSQHILHWG